MSDVKHRIFVGANTPIDIDGVFVLPQTPGFTFDRMDITFDTMMRTFDENPT